MDVDFVIQSEPWTEKELAEFRALMQQLKNKRRAKSVQKSVKRGAAIDQTK